VPLRVQAAWPEEVNVGCVGRGNVCTNAHRHPLIIFLTVREGLVSPEEAPFAGTYHASQLLPGADTSFSTQFLTIKKRSNVKSEPLSSGASH
jgi:hypothetical protein